MKSFKAAIGGGRRIVSLMLMPLLALICSSLPARANGVVGAISNGQIVYGSVSGAGVDQYTYYAGSGRYFVSLWEYAGHSTTTWASFYTYAPSGSREIAGGCDNNYNSAGEYGVYTYAGTYTVKVENCFGGSSPAAAYALQVIVLPATSGQPSGYAGGLMQPDVTYSGTTNLGEMDVWTVQKGSTASYTVTLTKTSGGAGYCPYLDEIRPNGTWSLGHTTCTNTTFTSNDGQTGTHYLLVQNSYLGNATGGYTVKVSGSGVTMPSQGKDQGSTCVPCEAAKKSAAAGGQPPAQSGGVASNGATATPP